MSLYLKYRPQTLEQVKGNEQLISTLLGMLQNKETFPHTLLFHGETGCGKTTLARIVSKELGCVGSDYREVDSADFRGIDTVREIRKNSMYKAIEGPCRVWVIDEVHKMTGDAQNAFLKILEDTPSHVYFILCTTEPQKLLATIKGRCSEFQVRTLSETQMMGLLRRVTREEGKELSREILAQISQDSLGHPRNALQILEQVLNVPEEQRMEVAQRAAAQQSQMIDLCRALLQGDNWKRVSGILEGLKDQDAEGIRRVVLGYCQAVLLKGENHKAAYIMEQFWEPTYNIGFPGIVFASYSVIHN